MKDDCECKIHDELIAGPEISEGVRPFVRHTKNHEVVSGFMKVVKDGEPLNDAELVKLTHIEDGRYEVESLYESSIQTKSGPPKVNSTKYRNGWDKIFGSKQEIGNA